MKKTAAVFCLLCCLLLCACAAPQLTGKWENDVAPIVYEFHADGTVAITASGRAPVSGTYAVDEAARQLTIEYDGFETVATYTLDGDTLTCVDSNGATVTLTRVQ